MLGDVLGWHHVMDGLPAKNGWVDKRGIRITNSIETVVLELYRMSNH